MSFIVKLALVLFGLAYLISPADIIPDFLVPFLGWLDDGLVLWTLYYLIRHNEMPWFLFKKKRPFAQRPNSYPNQDAKIKPGDRKTHSGTTARKSKGPKNPAPKSRPKKKTAHEILGLEPGAPWSRVQEAYKERIKKYHPDKVSHLGEEFSHLANEKFLEIQNAFETLKKQYGR